MSKEILYRGLECVVRPGVWPHSDDQSVDNRTQIVRVLPFTKTDSAFKAAKYIVGRIFDSNNVLGPIKFLLRILFGLNFDKKSHNRAHLE